MCDMERKVFPSRSNKHMDHEQVFILVTMLVFDAVDIFQSNIGTLPQLRMFFEL